MEGDDQNEIWLVSGCWILLLYQSCFIEVFSAANTFNFLKSKWALKTMARADACQKHCVFLLSEKRRGSIFFFSLKELRPYKSLWKIIKPNTHVLIIQAYKSLLFWHACFFYFIKEIKYELGTHCNFESKCLCFNHFMRNITICNFQVSINSQKLAVYGGLNHITHIHDEALSIFLEWALKPVSLVTY